MDTDGPLKVLFQKRAVDLLPLTGDVGATVLSAGPVELHALKRQVDCVLQLERAGETYYRHVEFQGSADAEMATRCFRYNTQLVLQCSAPVLTTVLYLSPPRPRRPPVFRVLLGGREVNRWRFEQICLWHLEARDALAHGAPGLLALVPLMKGGRDRAILKEALARVESAFPLERLSDAEDVLLALAGRYYTVSELAGLVGRDRMMQSSLYTEGLAEGRLTAERELCHELALKHHPAVFERAKPIIEACEDVARLRKWSLSASDVDDDAFLMLLTASR